MERNGMTKEVSIVNNEPSNLVGNLEYTKIETDKKITDGLAKETAGTGMPINKLKGNAKTMAKLANVGGGSKANGGGGIEEGIRVLVDNVSAKRTLQSINIVTQTFCYGRSLED